ncbi:DUF202 domain-containing protein [Streptomyces sp. NPDC005438]|uniref:DUF202 domain-containing protein n=1 Tax=Streptomyces sp. NPDC005438 TaxID=3156880 RepID=UPI0033A6C82B
MTGAARDPGAQPERTWLAWRRTTLAFTVVVVLVCRAMTHRGAEGAGAGVVLPCALAGLGWVLFVGLARRRARVLAGARPVALDGRYALAAVGCVVVLGVAGVWGLW